MTKIMIVSEFKNAFGDEKRNLREYNRKLALQKVEQIRAKNLVKIKELMT